VLRAAGETETTHENIQDWLELDEEYTDFSFINPDYHLILMASLHN
jgi:hypothetical protein